MNKYYERCENSEHTPVIPPWDEMDPDIIDRVRMLQKAGIRTMASCCGHGCSDAWVVVEGDDVEGLARILIENDQDHFSMDVMHSFGHPTRGEANYYVSTRIRWWGGRPYNLQAVT